ncbi:hypothetical protein [Kribbella antibiotica]|nr:hypothetical protein [Kribbella antibiotica]
MAKKSKPGDGSQAKGKKGALLYEPTEMPQFSKVFGRLQIVVTAVRPTSR